MSDRAPVAAALGAVPTSAAVGATAGLLQVADLRVSFDTEAGEVRAVAGVSFTLERGEVVALVGGSGSGKSVTALTLMGLTRPLGARTSGVARLEGTDLLGAGERELRRLRGSRMAMVFQDPMSSLNPVQRVGWQIAEQIRAHEQLVGARAALARAGELLGRVGMSAAGVRAYPHELSGGMRQRVMIAMALSCDPDLLIADEPTTALDVTTEARILGLLRELRSETDAGILLVTHDLGVVADLADRILVMRAGEIVERGTPEEIFAAARHPYTRSLLEANRPRPRRPRRAPGGPLLEARDLRVDFGGHGRGWEPRVTRPEPGVTRSEPRPTRSEPRPTRPESRVTRAPALRALDGVSLTLNEGETLGVVGESGAGKTTLIRCLLGLQKPTAGSASFRGIEIVGASRRRLAPVRRELQMVFQDPQAALNPRRRVEWILATGLRLRGVAGAQIRPRAEELLERVGLGAEHLDRYPHELSGGERQRVGIARALSCDPRAIVLDEPVSSLDATIRAQVLDLLVGLQKEANLTYLLVTHDLAVARGVADRIAVMRAGRIVELAVTEELFAAPRHEYTRELLAARRGGGRGFDPIRSADERSDGGGDRAAAGAVAVRHGEPAGERATGAGAPGEGPDGGRL